MNTQATKTQETLIGYARVSTQDQNLDLQNDALKEAGCKKIFSDTAGGAKADRKGLTEAISYLREDDVLVVWKLDRLGRSLKQLIEIVNGLSERNIGLLSLKESINTATSGGKLIFHIFGALAEFERDVIKERTHAGLAAARARGRKGGRPKSLDKKKIKMAVELYESKEHKIQDICQMLNTSRATFYRYLNAQQNV